MLFFALVAVALLSCGQSGRDAGEGSGAKASEGSVTVVSADTAVYKQIWYLLLEAHAKEETSPLLEYDEETEYEDNKIEGGVQIDYPGTEECYYHGFKCFPLENGTLKVYEYVAWVLGMEGAMDEDNDFEPSLSFYCYMYKDGTLAVTDPEPEVAEVIPEASLYKYRPIEFTETGIIFNDIYGTTFVWDGEKMVKQIESSTE